MGFLSYQISLALALLFVCADPVIPFGWAAKTLIRMTCAFIVLIFHPVGLLFYAMLQFALLIGNSWNGIFDRSRLKTFLRESMSRLLAILVPLICLILLAPKIPDINIDYRQLFSPCDFKIFSNCVVTIASPFLTYKIIIDIIFVAPVFIIYANSLRTGHLQLHAGMIIVGLIAVALSLVMPFGIGDAFFVNRRLPLIAALLLLAGVMPESFQAIASRVGVAAMLFALAMGRTIWIGSVWQSRQSDILAIESAIALVPLGSAVFVVQSEPNDLATLQRSLSVDILLESLL